MNGRTHPDLAGRVKVKAVRGGRTRKKRKERVREGTGAVVSRAVPQGSPFYAKGTCRFGDKCRMSHSNSRAAPAVSGSESPSATSSESENEVSTRKGGKKRT